MSLFSLSYLRRPVLLSTAILAAAVFGAAVLGADVLGAKAQENAALAVAPQAVLPAQTTAPQSADWRNEIGTFKIGLVRGWSSDMSRLALTRVENVFAKALGTPVKVVVFERFTSLMDAQADGRIDLAAYSARSFATLRMMCECVDALATPTGLAGQTGQIAVLAGDKSVLSSLAKIGNAKLGRIANAPIASDDMLRGTLMVNGRPITGKEEFWVEFPDVATAMNAYEAKQIDGFFIPAVANLESASEAGNPELNLLQMPADAGAKRPVTAVWRSAFWPYGPMAIRDNLASDAKTILLRTFEQLDVNAPLVHATLSEGLTGPYRKSDPAGYVNVSASIRVLVNQSAKWR